MLDIAYLKGAILAEEAFLTKLSQSTPVVAPGKKGPIESFISGVEKIQVGAPEGLEDRGLESLGGSNGPSTNPIVSWTSPVLLRSGRK